MTKSVRRTYADLPAAAALAGTEYVAVFQGSRLKRAAADDLGRGYEEGTWTPTIQDNSESNAEGQTYSVQSGQYRKVGNTVFIFGRIVVTSLGTLSTGVNVQLAGLPFTAVAAWPSGGFIVTEGLNLSIGAGNTVMFQVAGPKSFAKGRKWSAASGTSSFLLSELTASGELWFNGQYEV